MDFFNIFKKKNFCDICKKIKMNKIINLQEYEELLKELVENGNYEYVNEESSCSPYENKDENGYYIDDVICHILKCKKCKTKIIISCDTYHGRGHLKITKDSD